MSYDALFSPIKIRDLELKNRVVFPAMMTKMASSPDGQVTDHMIDYYVARVKGGCGLIMSEVCAIHESTHGLGYLALYTDEHQRGVKRLIDAIHEAEGKIGIQIWHGGMVAIALMPPDRKPMLTESMDKNDIDTIVAAYGKAVSRAVEAGCDLVEFHAAHTYLPHTFLSAAWNKRGDEYGGSLENRARFALECIASMRANMPEGMPLFMRFDCQDDYVENGLSAEDVIEFVKMAKAAGVDVADVSRGNGKSSALKYEVPSIDTPVGYNIDNVARIRKEANVPTIAVGRINTPELANSVIEEGKADFIAIGRGQIADPEFCNKAKAGKADEIRRCVACGTGCFDAIMDATMPHITCMRNPFVGKEAELIAKTDKPKKVLIAGAGMGGLVTANILKLRGHDPVVYEASNHVGGQMILSGAVPYKKEMADAAIWEAKEAKKLGIEINMNTPLTADIIESVKPDEVVIAIGATPTEIDVKGKDLPNVTNYFDVLSGKVKPSGNVVILGGRLVGLETAQYLTDKGASCTVIEAGERMGADLSWIRSMNILENIYITGVKQIVKAKCTEITENSVVYTQDGEEKTVEYDYVVIAEDATPRASKELQAKCDELGIPYHLIGDALEARIAINATAEAAKVAVNM